MTATRRVPEFRCKSKAELHEHLELFARELGFDRYGFVVEARATDRKLPRLHFVSNMPVWEASLREAVEAGAPHNVIRHATLQLPPCAWCVNGHVAGHTIVDDLARSQVSKVQAWNVRAGLLCPVSAPEIEWGALVLFSPDELEYDELEAVLPLGSLYAMNFVFWYLQLEVRPRRDRRELLTAREAEVLNYAAQGKTSIEMGLILGISPRTVEGYITTACAKLDARGRQAAITRATELQLIGGRNALKLEFERQRDLASREQASRDNPPQ
jgi:DNA-binding CsgD family transcriptional regulator